ncbi:MAG: transcriptional regulator PpsR [Paracoccaceae bacterium]|nr:transcriptional regulator PpsR [Paracoccaceae bacterium]
MKYWNTGTIPLIAPDVLGDIIATAADIAIVVSDVGRILSVLINPAHSTFEKLDHWDGRDIRDLLTSESVPKFEAQLQRFNAGEELGRAIELNHADTSQLEFPIRYSMHRIGPDGAILMLGRDLRPIAEMQQQLVNAQMALERDYEAHRENDTRFRVLMETSREAVVFVSATSGKVLQANTAAAAMLGRSPAELAGSDFSQHFEGRKREGLVDALLSVAVSEGSDPIEIGTVHTRRSVAVSPKVFRAGGERTLLCRIETADGVELGTDEMTEDLSGFYQEAIDGIVFTDKTGVIAAANEAFLTLVDAPHLTKVRGRSLGDFLTRGGIDLKVLIENAVRSGKMRLYATRLQSEFGNELPIEMSATYLNDRANPSIVFVIRDASRVEAVRPPVGAGREEGMRSVMELVGSATLKDIVSETTDVVEKMCIETAVELTRNNRVAAAEMLGLSRQSLYVKLRKYGLLKRD